MFGSVYAPNMESFGLSQVDLNPEMMEQLWYNGSDLDEFLKNHQEDLARYVREELKGFVVKAMFGGYNTSDTGMCFLTEIYVREEPTELQSLQIMDWITGQMSDGWGEGLEQRKFKDESIRWTQPIFDESTCMWDTEEYTACADYYVHAWTGKFNLDLVEKEIVDLDIPEPDNKEALLKEIREDLDKIIHKLAEIS
jgi:hypothetical protein